MARRRKVLLGACLALALTVVSGYRWLSSAA
jgi:hypothetical protein